MRPIWVGWHSSTLALFGIAGLLVLVSWASAASVLEGIRREENRTQKIGEQTQQLARELQAIVRDLQINRLLTQEENKDFVAAGEGMDEISRREVRAVLDSLAATRQALERAKQREDLAHTVVAQERLITRLTEELVRIQYRSQLRHLLEQMQSIVSGQRAAIRSTQNAAIEMAAAQSEAIRAEILTRVRQAQDEITHRWILVRDQVKIVLEQYANLPFTETLRQFRERAQALPIDPRLAETGENIRAQLLTLAVAGQRELLMYFAELLKVLQSAGLSPAEERAALESLIEKTEEALQQQQDLRAQTTVLGRDLTEPLRNEMARMQQQQARFVRDLAEEAQDILGAEPKQTQPATTLRSSQAPQQEQQPAGKDQQGRPQTLPAQPSSQKADQTPPAAAQPLAPAAANLDSAADRMTDAADHLTQARQQEAAAAQQQAINHIASALSSMRERLDAAVRSDQLDQLRELLDMQAQAFNDLGEIIRDQEQLRSRTQQAALTEQSAKEDRASENTRLALGEAQKDLVGRTEQLVEPVTAASAAAQPLVGAAGEMRKAASQLGQLQFQQALPHQSEALRHLHEAERKLAEAIADALDAEQPKEWLDHIGNLDQIVGQIEQMAREAEALPEAPAPAMAQQARDVAQELGTMASLTPTEPSNAARIQQGSMMMDGASEQLDRGQTGQAADTMDQAAATLTTARSHMAKEMAADLAKAIAEGRAKLAGQQTMRSQSEQPSSAASDKAAAKRQDGGKGQGFRGTGPTDFDPRQIEADLESGEWARLPERQREEVLQALRERYPARYERDLIRYYRNLSRLEAKP